VNVTIKLDGGLCREARHRAVDRGLSLSGWVAELVRRELAAPPDDGSLLEALAMKEGVEKEFVAPRDASPAREVVFP